MPVPLRHMASCCCCFSNNVRQLVLLTATLAITVLYSNLILFNFTAVLHKDLHPQLRPVEALDSLHEYSLDHDRRKRSFNLTSTADKAEKTVYTEEEGYPILPSTKSLPTTSTVTTTTQKSTTPRLIFFSNSPTPIRVTTRERTTRLVRQTSAPTTTTERTTTGQSTAIERTTTSARTSTTAKETTTSTTAAAPTTRNVVLEEVQRAIEKYEKKDKDLPAGDTKTPPEKVEEDDTKPMRDTPTKSTFEEPGTLALAQMGGIVPRLLIYIAPGFGCLLGTVPSMFLVRVLGVRVVLAAALVLSGILQIVLPFVVDYGYAIFAVRLLLGVAFSVSFPSAGALTAAWGTLKEQLSFFSTAFMFFVLAPVLSWPITMVLYSNDANLTWIYVTHAVVAFTMALIFFIFYRDHPHDHPWVNGIELNRIVAGKVRDLKTNRASAAPCSTLLRSLSAWSIWIAAVGCFSVFALFSTFLPPFLSCQQVFMVDHLGAYSVLPFLSLPLFFVIGGIANNLSCSSTTLHVRICNTASFISTALFLFILPIIFHAGTDSGLVLPTLVICIAPLGLIVSGFLRSVTLVGRGFAQHIVSCFGLCLGLAYTVIPVMVEFVVNNNSLKEWSIAFFITAGILVIASILFGVFGRGRSAGWAESTWDPLVRTKMLTTEPIDISADECGLYEMKLIPKSPRN